MENNISNNNSYNEKSVVSLEWHEHIRLRPGMYIGKLGDGSSPDDGIYILVKEVMDNSIDEFAMGNGKVIELDVDFASGMVRVRDYGRGIPLGKTIDCVAKPNTGAKYDSGAFKKSIGLNGVGTKAVNALSEWFRVQSIVEGRTKIAEFSKGILTKEEDIQPCDLPNGTIVEFIPDKTLFTNFSYISEYLEKLVWNYACLNRGLSIVYNKKKYRSTNGLLDLLNSNMDYEPLYPVVHISEDDFEFAFTHSDRVMTEDSYSFVNGQNTNEGGTHLSVFREAIVKVIKEFYKKDFERNDILYGMASCISLRINEPIFANQTKTKLGSVEYDKSKGLTVRSYIGDIVKRQLDNYLHKNEEIAQQILSKIQRNEKERKGMQNVKKLAKEGAKKVSITNRNLRDCRVHLTDLKDERRLETTIFITEGLSASGSITKSRDPNVQAVFSLRGKPENSFGESKEVVYKNDEFNFLHNALNIDEDMDNLRYNHVVIATDADVDGMHIRALLMTFFLQFFPELVRRGHVYILQTPLFRVRNKNQTLYCYTEEERDQAAKQLKTGVEITRFKGLGEISPEEFSRFIGKDIRLDPVILNKESGIDQTLKFFMGGNTSERTQFVLENLRYDEEE